MSLIFGILFGLNTALAAEPSVENVLEYYHCPEFLAQAQQQIEQSIERLRKDESMTPTQSAQVLRLAARIYRGDNLMKVFKFAYGRALNLEALQGLAAWQASPKGRVFGTAIHSYYTTKPHKRQKPPKLDPNRLNSLNTYLTTNTLVDLWLTFQKGADYGVLLALDTYRPQKERIGQKLIKERINKPNDASIDLAKSAAMSWSNSILAPLSTEDIDEISRFAHGVDGQASIEAFRRALEQTLERAAATLTTQLEMTRRH